MRDLSLHDPFLVLEDTVYPAWALSLYLPAPPEHLYDSHYHLRLFEALAREQLAAATDDLAIQALRRERPRVVAHLGGRAVPAGHGLAVFAYAPYELIESWCLAADELPLLRLGTRLDLAPIRRQLALHGPALVIAIDKEEARVFRLLLGEVQELLSLEGAEIKRHRQGGWSAPSWQRREDSHARRNAAAVARWLNSADLGFYAALHLAGPPEARSDLKRLLKPGVGQRLGADLALPAYLSAGQMANSLRDQLLRPPAIA